MLLTIFHGISMSLADSVPGVSGGTIAFILGFYEKFLTAIQDIFCKDNIRRKKAIIYLSKFAIGWIIGMSTSVIVISQIFESNVYFLSSVFLGLTVSAIPFIAFEELDVIKRKKKNGFFLFLGVGIVVLLTYVKENMTAIEAVNFSNLNIPQYIYLAAVGVIAISAMLLPGVSGSTLLLIFGVYVPTITALKEIIHLNFEYLPGVVALAIGVLVGVIFASKYIKKGLKEYRSQMVYLIIGLLIGSLYAISLGPTTLDVPKPPVSLESFNVLGFVLGIIILVGLEFFKRVTQKKLEEIEV